MTQVLVNDLPYRVDPAARTWGDLLDLLEHDASPHGGSVIGVSFDGVDDPMFLRDALQRQPLDGWRVIEVAIGNRSELIDAAMREVALAIPHLAESALALGVQFRRMDVSAARRDLAELADALRNALTLIELALRQRDESYRAGAAGVILELGLTVQSLVTAESDADWITVADLLEFDVAPLIARLQALVDGMLLARGV